MKKLLLALSLLLPSTLFAAYPSFTDVTNVFNALIGSAGGGTNTASSFQPFYTNSPNLFWTNGAPLSYWSTNQNFTSASVFPAGVKSYVTSLYISNSAAAAITNTFPFTAFSLSAGTNVSGAIIPSGTVLNLQFMSDGTRIFVSDYGANSATLAAIAILSGSGFLFLSNGVASLATVTSGGTGITNNQTGVTTISGVTLSSGGIGTQAGINVGNGLVVFNNQQDGGITVSGGTFVFNGVWGASGQARMVSQYFEVSGSTNSGIFLHSNTWSLFAVTNTMQAYGCQAWFGMSNNIPVRVTYTNGVAKINPL